MFVFFGKGRLSFLQLNQRVNQCANMLLSLEVKPGDRVATLLKNGIELVEIYFACAKIELP